MEPYTAMINGVQVTCYCGPPGYCYGQEFCSKPQLDSHGRDARTDASAGDPGPSNSEMIMLLGGAVFVVFLLVELL